MRYDESLQTLENFVSTFIWKFVLSFHYLPYSAEIQSQIQYDDHKKPIKHADKFTSANSLLVDIVSALVRLCTVTLQKMLL